MDRIGHWRRLITWNLVIFSIISTTPTVHSQELQAVSTNPTAAAVPRSHVQQEAPAPKKEPAMIVVAANPPSNWNSWTPAARNVTNWNPSRTFFSRSTYSEDPHPHNSPQGSNYAQGARNPYGFDKPWGMEDVYKGIISYGRSFFSQFKGHGGQGREDDGGHEGPKAGRGLMGWLSRLIGVDGKSLGEFLREYQVHVLYDLVFTFFKWIFFLYAGLLIP